MIEPYVSEGGSVAVYARVWRSAPWPAGILYWDDFREIQLPMNRREYEAAKAERWVPWNKVMNFA